MLIASICINANFQEWHANLFGDNMLASFRFIQEYTQIGISLQSLKTTRFEMTLGVNTMDFVTPDVTYRILLIVQALHLLHHRLVKRHISFVEVITAAVLCMTPGTLVPPFVYVTVHLGLTVIQIIGSIFIYRLSPDWKQPNESAARHAS